MSQKRYTFPNGYGASVIDHGYGSDAGLLEVAVLKDGRIDRDGPVVGDGVRGWLTKDEAASLLDQIAALEAPGTTEENA